MLNYYYYILLLINSCSADYDEDRKLYIHLFNKKEMHRGTKMEVGDCLYLIFAYIKWVWNCRCQFIWQVGTFDSLIDGKCPASFI